MLRRGELKDINHASLGSIQWQISTEHRTAYEMFHKAAPCVNIYQ